MSPITSEHSFTESLGAPPAPPTPEEVASVKSLLNGGPGKRFSANERAEMESMLFDGTSVAVAPAAAPWHPKHED